jgi:hypothetical protein
VGIAGCMFFVPAADNREWQYAVQNIDYLGGILLLVASTLLVFALQQGGSTAFSWSSAAIVSSLVISSICWISFAVWTWTAAKGAFVAINIRSIIPLNVFSRPIGPAAG